MSNIEWGRGSAFNLGRVGKYRVERSNTAQGWHFLASTDEQTYMHVDNVFVKTKEDLNDRIQDWINEK